MDVYISQHQSVYTEGFLDIDPESYKKYLNGKEPSIESLKDYIDKYPSEIIDMFNNFCSSFILGNISNFFRRHC